MELGRLDHDLVAFPAGADVEGGSLRAAQATKLAMADLDPAAPVAVRADLLAIAIKAAGLLGGASHFQNVLAAQDDVLGDTENFAGFQRPRGGEPACGQQQAEEDKAHQRSMKR